jgi:uncharacterized membrane protein
MDIQIAVPLAVTGYEIALWLHITAAVVGLGATFATALFVPVAMSMDPRHLPFVHRMQITINRYMAGPGLLVILATGIYQAIDGNWDFGAVWISASFLIVFVLGGLQGGYFIPTDRKLEEMVSGEIAAAGTGPVELSEDYLSKLRREGMFGGFAGFLVVAAILLMVLKPGM